MSEGDPGGSVPPRDAADRDAHLAGSSCRGAGVRTSPEDRCRNTSRPPVRVGDPVEFFAVEKRENLATEAETLPPFLATAVNIFRSSNLTFANYRIMF